MADHETVAKISGVNGKTATAKADAGDQVLDANGNTTTKVNAIVENGKFEGDVSAVAKGATVLSGKEALEKASMAIAKKKELEAQALEQQETNSFQQIAVRMETLLANAFFEDYSDDFVTSTDETLCDLKMIRWSFQSVTINRLGVVLQM